MLTAAAYLVKATELGQRLSLYEVADMFDISDLPLRKCYRLMESALGKKRSFARAERSRNAYDIYAEILQNEASGVRQLLRKIHISSRELSKHLSFLREHGLVMERSDGRSKSYFPTEKGHNYLEFYSKLKETIEGRA